jgi:hypothetical protein
VSVLPPKNAGEDADRAADERRDRSGTEAMSARPWRPRSASRPCSRHPRSVAERKLPARRLEHRAYLSLGSPSIRKRPGHGERRRRSEHSDRDQSGLVAEGTGNASARHGKRLRVAGGSLEERHAGLNGTHSVTRGRTEVEEDRRAG